MRVDDADAEDREGLFCLEIELPSRNGIVEFVEKNLEGTEVTLTSQ